MWNPMIYTTAAATGRLPDGLLSAGRLASATSRARTGPRQLVGKLQERICRARHDVAGDVDDLAATAAGRLPELLERLPGLDAVPLGEYADRLLDPDPGRQRMLELADGGAQPPCLAGTGRLAGGLRRGSVRQAVLRREQIGQDHGAREVRQVVAADTPAILGTPDNGVVWHERRDGSSVRRRGGADHAAGHYR